MYQQTLTDKHVYDRMIGDSWKDDGFELVARGEVHPLKLFVNLGESVMIHCVRFQDWYGYVEVGTSSSMFCAMDSTIYTAVEMSIRTNFVFGCRFGSCFMLRTRLRGSCYLHP